MKKIHLITYGYIGRGHGKEYVRNFCSHLGDNFDITLYVASNNEIDTPKNIKTIYIPFDWESLNIDNYKKYGRFNNVVKQLKKQSLTSNYCKDILKDGHIKNEDTVFIMDYTALSLVSFFKGIIKIKPKTFLWMHSARFDSKDIFYKVYKSLVKYAFKKYVTKYLTGIIVNGDFIKTKINEVLKYDNTKIHTIQYPSEIEYKKVPQHIAREKLGIDLNEKVVLFFGGLRKDKNIEEVIRSTALAKSKPLLLMAGSENTVKRTDIENWLKKYNHQNYKLDIDYISEENMALYYSASDTLLLTYMSESASQSGPLSLAREFELPAIVTDTGEIGYYVKNNDIGLVASPHKPDDFIEKIDVFFSNTATAKSFVQNVNVCKGKYSWNAASLKYKALFNS